LLSTVWIHKRDNSEEIGEIMICTIEGMILIWLPQHCSDLHCCLAMDAEQAWLQYMYRFSVSHDFFLKKQPLKMNRWPWKV